MTIHRKEENWRRWQRSCLDKVNVPEPEKITGADATACVKSTSYNLVKAGYKVHVISDCVTSYDLKKLDEMFAYYTGKGCEVKKLGDYTDGKNTI